MSHEGRCLCGAVSFTAEAVDPHVHACHCSMCRNWTGGPMMAASATGVVFQGDEHLGVYQSSDWAERGFCRQCGTSLYYRLREAEPGSYIMATGSFDSDDFTVVGEIYVDEKPDGYDFAGDHPRMTGAEFLASMGVELPE